ncbi:sprT domain-containing protein [Pedobacter frigiditerrae]|uniref:SprT domain-containing protein n=1 Tax=Pedobacter frigiditerrae TaxID=2530452 RepID=A0A4R0N4H3_9SPHI|nr:SprT-like domain-containing protein [Pedobacter frigiditerrae]TCC94267.1 sprT domain-containing protein [Pedobacter frigiditerrae]
MDKVNVLAQYMPAPAAPIIAKWIDYFQCEFRISKNRSTKLGDYRHPFKDKGHKISVNNDLNQYAFLVTTVHEFAHLLTWNDHKNKAKPHGTEWKTNFKRMMNPFFEIEVFPPDIHQTITNYLNNPTASSCTDLTLARALKKYDTHLSTTRIEELPIHAIFVLKDGRKFKKGERIRKRYRCECLDNGNIYLFNPLAEVLLATGT